MPSNQGHRPLSSSALQTGMPMTALSVLGGQFRLKAQTRAQLYQDFLPWAVRAGFRSADLMCLYYEKHLEVSCLLSLSMALCVHHKVKTILCVDR